MQQTREASWMKRSSLDGVLRYQWKVLGTTVLWVLLVMLAAQLVSFLLPLVTDIQYQNTGVYVDIGSAMFVSLICSCIAAGKTSRFLLRFGTPRFSVWLGNLLGLFAGLIAFLIGSLLLSMLMGGLTLLMSNQMPRRYVFETYFSAINGTELFGSSIVGALQTLPRYILYTLEWTCMYYLLGCCFRRNKWATLFVVIGIPMILTILMLIPAVQNAVQVVENGTQGDMMVMGAQWMTKLIDIAKFVREQWPTIQLLAALVSLPLSYLCMRGTQQP